MRHFQIRGPEDTFKMFKTKKLFKRYIYTIIFACAILVGVFYLSHETHEFDNAYKISVIEESIKSYDNHGLCKIPDLPLNNPEIMKFYTKNENINCGEDKEDWVICKKSVCTIKESIVQRKGSVSCSFTDLIRKTDYRVRYGKTTRSTDHYTLHESDFVKVNCKADNDDRWMGILCGIRELVETPINKFTEPYLNVLLFGFDSLSRNAFIRKLPKSYEYLVKNLNTKVLLGYNIVGDGTPQALTPILTGHTELELPETRKRMKNSNYVDVYPMIWNAYKRHGYVTAFNEDVPRIGTYTYRLNGFDKQPTDHYLRTYYLELENYLSSFNPYCIGGQTGHAVMLNYTKNFMLKYAQEVPRFVFSFHGELSHDSINLIGAADDDLKDWLIDLENTGVLNNTILIIMSDHGNRFAEVRNTLQGKQEERLPFFSFTFPKWFHQKYPNEYNNFLSNLDSLTTPFDVHETLLDILRIQHFEMQTNNIKPSRAISLFNAISKTRSCADAYIEPHWCACLNWKQINDTTSDIARQIAKSVVETINTFTEESRNVCEKFEVDEINWVMKLAPNENLLRFKTNRDTDGFLGEFTSNTNISFEIYQVKVTVIPGYSIFEASVTHLVQNGKFIVKMTDISRVNKYGSQANCIYETQPQLRKYCFCKNQF